MEQATFKPVQNVSELIAHRRCCGAPFLKFLDVSSLYCEIYSLAAGAIDLQMPHAEDEVYYVVQGAAKIRIAAQDFPVRVGDVIFVPAGEPHFFSDITSDLELLVFFSKCPPA